MSVSKALPPGPPLSAWFRQESCIWGWEDRMDGQGVYLSSLLNWGWASAISRLLLNTALL